MILSMLPCRSSLTNSSSKKKRLSNWNYNKPKSNKKTSKNKSKKSVSGSTLPSNNSQPIKWITKRPMTTSTLHSVLESNLNKNSTKSTKSTTRKNKKWPFLKTKSPKLKKNSKILCVITMKFKLTTFSSSLILQSRKFKPLLLKIMWPTWKK